MKRRYWMTGVILLGASLLWLGQVTTAEAHGGTLRLDGDPAHLIEDLIIEFGLPLIILGGGALIGVVLSRWLARRTPVDSDDRPERP